MLGRPHRAVLLMDRGEFRAALPVFEVIEAAARDADDLAIAAVALGVDRNRPPLSRLLDRRLPLWDSVNRQ
jgi:hypothetical protein